MRVVTRASSLALRRRLLLPQGFLVPSAVQATALSAVLQVGRLVEVRFEGNPTLPDVLAFNAQCRACVAACAAKGKRAALCTDLRGTQLFQPEVSDELLALMRSDNPQLERNAFLSSSALLTLQVQRLVNEAARPGRRRVFAEVLPMLQWLDEILDLGESARARMFLDDRR